MENTIRLTSLVSRNVEQEMRNKWKHGLSKWHNKHCSQIVKDYLPNRIWQSHSYINSVILLQYTSLKGFCWMFFYVNVNGKIITLPLQKAIETSLESKFLQDLIDLKILSKACMFWFKEISVMKSSNVLLYVSEEFMHKNEWMRCLPSLWAGPL